MKDFVLRLEPVIAAGGALLFVVIYLLYAKWWKSAMGRHMMSFMIGCFIVISLSIVIRFFPSLAHIWSVRFGAWFVVIFIMWWRAWIAFRVLVLKRYDKFRGDDNE